MARARNIKPGLFRNEVLGTLDPLITILFQSLWCLADRRGRLEDRPMRIKADTFPYRENIDINGYLTVLERCCFIRRYEVAGLKYIQVVNFEKHQYPHKTERESEIPAPPEECSVKTDSCALTVSSPLNNDEPTEALPPDLLIPDSLIPDSHTSRGSRAVAFNPSEHLLALGVGPQVIDDWLKLRKAKRAAVTVTAIDGLVREAEKSGISPEEAMRICCERGWQSFRSDWVPEVKKSAGWWAAIGFSAEWEAINAGATQKNAHLWRDGRPTRKLAGVELPAWGES